MKTNFKILEILISVLEIVIYLFKGIIWINFQVKKLIKLIHKFIEENLVYFTFLNTLIVTIYYITILN